MRREDIPAGLRLCRASGWNQLAQDWELFLAASPDGCRVAVEDRDLVIGSVATLRYGDVFAWISMVLVDPLHRGAGIGTRLLRESLDIIHDVPLARLDATPEGRPVYAHSGFRDEYRLQRMQRAPKRGTAPFPSLFETRPMTDQDVEGLASWDRSVFGADRRLVLDAFRRNAPEYAWVATTGSAIEGYAFGRHGYAFEQIGPVVARSDTCARTLVARCISAGPDRPFIIDVPLHAAWVAWLSTEFTVQRPFVRMSRGEGLFRENIDQMFAIGGPEFG